jgi:hypothetical protein
MRYFQNLYAILSPCKKIGISLGFDYGLEQKSKGDRHYNSWYGCVAIARYQSCKKLAIALRGEYYYDRDNVIVNRATFPDFRCSGLSLNLDYQIRSNAVLRVEGKTYHAEQRIFTKGSALTMDNTVLTAVLAVNL